MSASPVVAITGASAGIGRATALRLARDGAAVVVSARRGDRLNALAAEITASGGRASPIVADVTREGDMHALVDRAIEDFGRLDVMICNAGFGVTGSADDVEPRHVRKLLDVNFLGTYHAARAALRVFRAERRGHLIVVSSIVGRRGVPFMGAYSATKFAQVGLAECLRSELHGSGIHLTVVFPISTETEFFEVMARESGFASRADGPRQKAEDVAHAIARAVARPLPEVYPYRKARGLVLLNAVAPGLCDRFVKKFGRKPVTVASA
jgi:NADP-dependent 3-hydroxy acid dehydrogenase YdfG